MPEQIIDDCDLCGSEQVPCYVSAPQAASDFSNAPLIKRCEICYQTLIGNRLEWSSLYAGEPSEAAVAHMLALLGNVLLKEIRKLKAT